MEKPGHLLTEDDRGEEDAEEEEMDSGDGGNPQDIWGDENKFSCLKFMIGIITIFTLVRYTFDCILSIVD